MSYSSNGNRPKLSEKGLLTPDNCVVALIDHQGQCCLERAISIARNHQQQPWHSEKPQGVHVPVILTTVETKSFSGICGRSCERYSRAGTHRAFFHELVGRTRTLSLQSRKADAKRSCLPACGRRLRRASHGTGDPRRLRNLRGGRLLR